MISGHTGLQKKARSLKKQWKNKAHSDDSDVFWSKAKRKCGLDIGTLEVQAAVDTLWNKRVRNEVEQEINNIADETSETKATPPRISRLAIHANGAPAATGSLNFHMPSQDCALSSYISGTTILPSAVDKDDEN